MESIVKSRKDVHDLLAINKVIPVVGTTHLTKADDPVLLAKALYKAGCKVIEFVLRSDNADKVVNKTVFAEIRKACKDMLIGVGTCVTPVDIRFAKEAGADFAVSAQFSWLCVEEANQLGLFYLPGIGELTRISALITGEEKSPHSGKTVHELLGGQGVATLKIHPHASTDLIDVINSTVMNDYQKKQGIVQFIDLEPSELVQKNWGIDEVGQFSKKAQVKMLGGTYPYMLPDGMGGFRDLIQEKNWEGITALTKTAMAVTHGQSMLKAEFFGHQGSQRLAHRFRL